MYKYFIVPYNNQFDGDKEVLKEIIVLIGQKSKISGFNSKLKKGIKTLAHATGASKREVKQLIESVPSLRARDIWPNCVNIKRISRCHYIEILKEILKNLEAIDISDQLRHKIESLEAYLNSTAGHLSRAEYYGLLQVEGNIARCNQVNKTDNSAEIANILITGIRNL